MKANRTLLTEAKTRLKGTLKTTFLITWLILSYFILWILAETYLIPQPTYENAFRGFFSVLIPTTPVQLLRIIISLAIEAPFQFGITLFFLHFSRSTTPPFTTIFAGIRNFGQFWKTFILMTLILLLINVATLFLIIPGILAYYACAMSLFILADEPHTSAIHAIKKSIHLMRGHKWQLFKLHLRFIPSLILGIITLGIAFFWIMPRWWTVHALFYETIKTDA